MQEDQDEKRVRREPVSPSTVPYYYAAYNYNHGGIQSQALLVVLES